MDKTGNKGTAVICLEITEEDGGSLPLRALKTIDDRILVLGALYQGTEDVPRPELYSSLTPYLRVKGLNSIAFSRKDTQKNGKEKVYT